MTKSLFCQDNSDNMKHFLAISNRENSDVVIGRNIWGVSRRFINQINKPEPGDTLMIYVGQQIIDKDTTLPPAITGSFEIISDVYEDESEIFRAPAKLGNERFPLRINLKAIKIFEDEVHFKPLIPDLKFITNKKQWSGHIRGQAMREIPDEDYQLIMKAAETPRG